jgi:hypothetical protein
MPKKIEWISIAEYGKRHGVKYDFACIMARRLSPEYLIRWPNGRITNVRADAPAMRAKIGRPRNNG